MFLYNLCRWFDGSNVASFISPPFNLPMSRFIEFQPNKHKCGDCVVRACVKATGLSWEDVYVELCKLGLKFKMMPNDNKVFYKFLENHGFTAHTVKPVRGERRPTPKSLSKSLPSGVNCVASLAGHLVAIDHDGWYDIWDSGYKSVYKYWTKEVA